MIDKDAFKLGLEALMNRHWPKGLAVSDLELFLAVYLNAETNRLRDKLEDIRKLIEKADTLI